MCLTWGEGELDLLADTPLFQGIPEKWLRFAVEEPSCFRKEYGRGEVIYSPERFQRCLGVLLSGRAGVSKGALVVSTLERGDLFGAAALFNRRDGYETTITALNACATVFFPEGLVALLLEKCPGFSLRYIRYISERIHFLSKRLEDLTAPGASGRLSRYLLQAGGEDGTLSYAATELARRLDISRASLYRAFEELEGAGAIRRAGKTIAILDRESLSAHCKNLYSQA